MMRVLDLFSGIGGFSLGLERAGFKTIGFCEIDPYCQAVLRKHWPGVPICEDMRTARFPAADVICGGFPCQDISLAGNGSGLSGSRSGLWRELLRAVRLVRPLYAIVENVAALLSRGMGEVVGDLAEVGYDTEWNCISASALGAPHHRDRVWVVAYPAQPKRERVWTFTSRLQRRLANCGRWSVEPDVGRVANGLSDRVDRVGALGNAVVPQIPEMIGRAINDLDREFGG